MIMKSRHARIIMLALLAIVLFPALSMAVCKNYVYQEAQPKGYYVCADNTYPYYRDHSRNIPRHHLPPSDENDNRQQPYDNQDRSSEPVKEG